MRVSYFTSATCAFHAEWCHQPDGLYSWARSLRAAGTLNFRGVEIGRIVLGKHFSFRHGGSGG